MSILQFGAGRTASVCATAAILAVLVAATAPAQNRKKGGNPIPPDPAIVFVASHSRGSSTELMVADADGGNMTALLGTETEGYFFPAWSPDLDPATPGFQGKVVYEFWYGDPGAPFIDIHTIDVVVTPSSVQGQNDALLVQNAFLPAWSPAGDKIAYVGNHDAPEGIYVLDLNTGVSTLAVANLTPTTDPWVWPPDQYADASWPAWSSDGTTLAFAYSWFDPLANDGAGAVFSAISTRVVVDSLGNVVTDRPITPVVETGARAIDWSRDDRFLAYETGGEIRVADLWTGAIESLPSTRWAAQPTWPPDRTDVLAFMSRRGDSGSGKRKIVLRDLQTQEESDLLARKGWHLWEPDWRRP